MDEDTKDLVIMVTMPLCTLLFAITFLSVAFLIRQLDKRVDDVESQLRSVNEQLQARKGPGGPPYERRHEDNRN